MVHPPRLPFSERATGLGLHLYIVFDARIPPHLDLLRLHMVSPVVRVLAPRTPLMPFWPRSIFAALCDITPDKTIRWIVPGSHRLGMHPFEESADVCIFGRNIYHRSLKNETDQPRFAYAVQFQSDSPRDAQTGLRESPCIGPRLRASEVAALWNTASH